jgi:hypothetical protein
MIVPNLGPDRMRRASKTGRQGMKRILLAAIFFIAVAAPAWAQPSIRLTHPEGPVEEFSLTTDRTVAMRAGDTIELFGISPDQVRLITAGDDLILIFEDGTNLVLGDLRGALDSGATVVFADAIPELRFTTPDDVMEFLAPLAAAAGPDTVNSGPDRIIGTRYGFFDERGGELDGLGLYSYAVLTSRFAVERNVAFLSELFQSTPMLSRDPPNPAALNVVHIPTKDAGAARVDVSLPASARTPARLRLSAAERSAGAILDKHYDYEFALDILDRFCAAKFESCAGADAAGPYLIVLNDPIRRGGATRYLFLDLTAVHPKAFGELLSAFKAQVRLEDFTDRQKVDSLRLALLDLTLDAADWVNPISEGVAGIMELVWPDG